MNQNNRFLEILRQRPVNSFESLRMEYKQMPRIVKDLKREGHKIETKRMEDTSVTYTLVKEHIPAKTRTVRFVGGTAIIE